MKTQELFDLLHRCSYHYAVLHSSQIKNIVSEIFSDQQKMSQHVHRSPRQKQHFEKLEKSVLAHGFRNPICVMAGFVPPRHQRAWNITNAEMYETLYCTAHGGSRLWVAQKHGLKIPCVIADYMGLLHGSPEYRLEELINFFADPPKRMIMSRKGLMAQDLPASHMK